jgi:hypothetical protein
MWTRWKRSPTAFARTGVRTEAGRVRPPRLMWSYAVTSVKALETSGASYRARLHLPCTRKALSVDLFFSLPETAGFFLGAPTSACSQVSRAKENPHKAGYRFISDGTAPGRDGAAAAHGGSALPDGHAPTRACTRYANALRRLPERRRLPSRPAASMTSICARDLLFKGAPF